MHRSTPLLLFFILSGFAVLFFLQCATPTQPTGGPPDRTPPEILDTEPAAGTTHFDGDRIRFHFSKYIDRNSFRSAFQIEPDIDLEFDISWRRRTATVRFDQPLPDATTIIFTLGTDLADTRNNRIPTPFQLALSTGPEIDEGRITATVRDAKTGKGRAGDKVVLYRHPVDLERGANYVAEADTGGVVRFNYLRDGTYKAFWLDDRNRNRRWDRQREAAQPFRTDTLLLDAAGEADPGTVFVIQQDTTAPVLLAVGLHSEVRLRLRFSEEVQLADDASIAIRDENGSLETRAVPLYADPKTPNILFAQSLEPLPDQASYIIEMQGIADLAGNKAISGIDSFPGSDEPDTTFARFIENDTRHGIAPSEPLAIRYARLLDQSPEVLDSLVVVISENTIQPWPHAEVQDNLLFIFPDGEWKKGESYTVRIWDGDRMQRRNIEPRVHFEDELGAIGIVVEDPDTDTTRHRVQLVNEQDRVIRSETFLNEIEMNGVPPGNYLVRVFELREGLNEWDPGSVDPFRPPARFYIQRNVPVQRGLTGQISVIWP